jgi:formiminotetrahydrofolate cyclodeaminase
VKRSFESLKLWAKSTNDKVEELSQERERQTLEDMAAYEAIEGEYTLPLRSVEEMTELEKRIAATSERHKLVSIPPLLKNDSL